MSENPPGGTGYVAAIVEQAARLFAAKGYHATSMRDIGRQVGVHAGSLYVHIASKEDLLESIVQYIMERSEKDMTDVLARAGTATEQLREVAARDLALIGENKEFATVFFHEWRNLSERRQQVVIASRDRWEDGLRTIIVRGIESGEFRRVDPRTTSIAFTSILNWSYSWYSPNGDLSTEELADKFTNLLIEGLRK